MVTFIFIIITVVVVITMAIDKIISPGGNSAYVLFIGTSVAQLGKELANLDWDFRFYLLILWQVIIVMIIIIMMIIILMM